MEILIANPLLLLFVVAALGMVLGRIRILGVQVGVAAVLFTGLAFGALDPQLRLPEFVVQLGLAIFVYMVGLASGRAFMRSFNRRGLRANALVLTALLCGAGLTLLLAQLLALDPAVAAGLFVGATTNTPALAGVLETLRNSGEAAQATAVVAYSLAYPGGVLGVIIAIALIQRLWRIDYSREAAGLRDYGATGEHLANLTVRITRAELSQAPIQFWREQEHWHVILGRYRRHDELDLVQPDTVLQVGDEVTLVGTHEDLHAAAARMGEVVDINLTFDHSRLDFRRVFVSNPKVAGRTLAELRIPQRLGAVITRVRRGDMEFLPSDDLRLELGDRVRVVCRRDHVERVSQFFGDSYQALSEVNIPILATGLCLGLMLGMVPIPLPGGLTLQLGFAGGPLLVALALGAIGHSGPVLWNLPFSANLTLRQFGLLLFLAGVGTNSGYAFASTLRAGEGLDLLLAGALLTFTLALSTLIIGYRLLKLPMNIMLGVVCGQHTQPAALGYAVEQSRNDLPHLGYATVFPLATVVKIILAQLILLLSQV
ncbi:aspartate:alanine exchanger family transporter [Thiorhodospira sibirica]|uniref:aspartate:alanine exchanger family transporter n=1 Tax=Thiorhodospira sibirica TaxID=154347 RepID=UPI001C8ED9E1|nr:aspartate:alanine exchanger family transporter [Thiorhodospira sibirica]